MRKRRITLFGLLVSGMTLLSSPAWAGPEDLCWVYSWPHC